MNVIEFYTDLNKKYFKAYKINLFKTLKDRMLPIAKPLDVNIHLLTPKEYIPYNYSLAHNDVVVHLNRIAQIEIKLVKSLCLILGININSVTVSFLYLDETLDSDRINYFITANKKTLFTVGISQTTKAYLEILKEVNKKKYN